MLEDILSRGVVERLIKPAMDRFETELPGVDSNAKGLPSVGVEGRGGGADWLGRLLADERDGDETIVARGGEAATDLFETEWGTWD